MTKRYFLGTECLCPVGGRDDVRVQMLDGKLVAVYFQVGKGKAVRTVDFKNQGRLFFDFNVEDSLLGVEVLI